MVSAAEDVVQNGDDDDSAVHDHAPVHRLPVHRGGEREKREDENREQKGQGGDVDSHAEAAKRPPMWWKWLAADALEEHTTYCDHVRGHQGSDGQSHDG